MQSRIGLLYAFAAVSIIAVVVTLVVVGLRGDDDDGFADIVVAEGRVSCEAFVRVRSYNYRTDVVLDLAARAPSMDDSDGRRPDAFLHERTIRGSFADGNYAIVIAAPPGQAASSDTVLTVFEDTAFFLVNDRWTSRPLAGLQSFPVPYLPSDTCKALAPDLFLSGLASVPETISGISAQKYHFDSLESDLPDNHPSFGAGSDAARFVNVYSGDVWVADEGGYIVKMALSGTGQYDNGRELTVEISYELSNINDSSIQIGPPI